MWKYRPELDGLRAIAVVVVILFHAGGLVPGGFVGVDVFFTLSGYLVTGVIAAQLESDTFTLRAFWMRRIRRLLPAALLVSGTCLALGYFYLIPSDLGSLGKSNLAHFALLANVSFWLESGYFAEAAHTKPLLHYWSLAVEEQYYLLFPPFLMLSSEMASRARLCLVAIVAAASFALSVYGSYSFPSATFYLLPTRAWELLVGSGLALLVRMKGECGSRGQRRVGGWLGLSAILLSIVSYDEATRFPGLAALLPVSGTALIIWATSGPHPSALKRCLAISSVVWIGRLSYSLYLWHWPCLAARELLWPSAGAVSTLIAILLAFLLAMASFYLVEGPVRQRRLLGSNNSLACALLVLAAAQAGVSLTFYWFDGLGSRLRFEGANRLIEDVEWVPRSASVTDRRVTPILLDWSSQSGTEAYRADVDYIVWGDSHAGVMGEVIRRVAQENRTGLCISRSGRPPGLGVWVPARERREEGLRDNLDILEFILKSDASTVFLVARWQLYAFEADSWFLQSDAIASHTPEQSIEVLRASLRRVTARLRAAGKRVVLVRQVPEIPHDDPSRRMLQSKFVGLAGSDVAGGDFGAARHFLRSEPLLPVFSELSGDGCEVLDAARHMLDDGGRHLIFLRESSLYRDRDHLSLSGVAYLAEQIRDDLRRAAGWD